MDLTELHKRLIAAARATPPDDRVPYAFEQRVLARLRTLPRPDLWTEWVRALWCSAGVCAAVTMLIGVWSWTPTRPPEPDQGFTQDLEQAIWSGGDDDAGW
jgi:predicted Abi (CAAX) family protease